MEPLDPLDQLLRGRPANPWTERARSVVAQRWPWLVAGVVIVGVVAVVLVVRAPPAPVAVTLPRAGADPVSVGGDPATSGAAAASTVPAAGAAPSALVVHVAGAVNVPGLVTLPVGSRVADAVAQAGGLRPDADGDRVNLAAPLADGVRVFIPVAGQPDPPPAMVVTGAPAAGDPAAVPSATAPVDLNVATAAQLEALPGVGPSTAAAIVSYRTEHGRFRTVDELQEVRGIGPAKFEAIEPMVTVGP